MKTNNESERKKMLAEIREQRKQLRIGVKQRIKYAKGLVKKIKSVNSEEEKKLIGGELKQILNDLKSTMDLIAEAVFETSDKAKKLN
jgi:hypothetical protein